MPLTETIPADTKTCPACPHDTADHDRIGTRFCAATAASALERGCVCVAR